MKQSFFSRNNNRENFYRLQHVLDVPYGKKVGKKRSRTFERGRWLIIIDMVINAEYTVSFHCKSLIGFSL